MQRLYWIRRKIDKDDVEIRVKTAKTDLRIAPVTMLCYILSMSIKRWLAVIALVLLSIALCVVILAD
jgi:hypothetical protein